MFKCYDNLNSKIAISKLFIIIIILPGFTFTTPALNIYSFVHLPFQMLKLGQYC